MGWTYNRELMHTHLFRLDLVQCPLRRPKGKWKDDTRGYVREICFKDDN